MTHDRSEDTLPRLLVHNAKQHGQDIALREKDRGIWTEITWSEYADTSIACAAAFDSLGVGSEDAVIILGDNRVRLYIAMVATSMLRAYAMPAYPGAALSELQHFVGEANVAAAVAEDQEQVDKLLDLREAGNGSPAIIIYDDSRGMGDYTASGLTSWDEFIARGREALAADPALLDRLINGATPTDPAVFMHSSGTTGKPKGIVISHANAIAGADNAFAGGAFDTGEEVLAYLPMAWVGDFALSIGAAIAYRFTINVPERQETVQRDMREIAPSFYLAAPRTWDNMLTMIQVGIENSTPLKKRIYHFFMDRSIEAEKRKLKGERPGPLDRLGRLLGEWLVFGPIKDQFGLTRLKSAFTGGEAIGEDTFVFYRGLGIALRQFYGQTETSAFTAVQSVGEVQLHTVGKPLPGIEAKIADDGEILLRSGNVFAGYYNNPDATAEALEDGWLRSGDAGYLEDDGHLVVLGRLSEVVYTKGGERYVPNYVENRLKFSPYIKDAAVIGAGKDELTAMVCIDFESVGHWAEVKGVPYTSYADLSQRDEVAALLKEAFVRVNGVLPDALKMHRFVGLPKEFDPDDGEITRTRKLRRKVVEERYSQVIEALYDNSSDVHVKAEVTYETGETGFVERTLPIREV
ncbi:MAG: long-chain fatty acid--CoA ligase [Planctomycetota bacterium]|nr:MAG: long-chain fatty acid--CoA ligase [Planctomycetota bacterium]